MNNPIHRTCVILFLIITLCPLFVGCPEKLTEPTPTIECPEGYHPCESEADTLTCCPDDIPATITQTHVPWPGLADTPWPMFMHDPQHSGRSQYSGPALGEIEWAIPLTRLKTEIFTNPVINPNGNIILSTRHDLYGEGKLFSITPDSIINWKVDLGGHLDSSPLISADGSIYVCQSSQDWDKIFLAKLNLIGNIIWKQEFDLINDHRETGNLSPNISMDGNTIYICGFDSTLTAVSSNGNIQWQFPANSPTKGPPSISPDGQSIYFISTDNELFSIDNFGIKNWSLKFNKTSTYGNSCYPVIDSDGNIYLYLNGVMRSISPHGYVRWEDQSTFFWEGYLNGCSIGPYGGIYITAFQYLSVYNYNGTLRWSKPNYMNQSKFTIDREGNSYIGLKDYNQSGDRSLNLYSFLPSGSQRYAGVEGSFTIASQGCISSDKSLYIGSDASNTAAFFKIK